MDYEKIFNEPQINGMLMACFALERRDEIELLSIYDEVDGSELQAKIKDKTGVNSPGQLDEVAYYMRGWIALRIKDYLSKGKTPVVCWRDFRECLSSAAASVKENFLMNYATAVYFDQEAAEKAIRERPLYVRQMAWIDLPLPLQKKAAADIVKASVNRDKWKEDDSIGEEDVEDFEAQLINGHSNHSRTAAHETAGCKPEETGRATYSKCMDTSYCRAFRISNKAVNDGAVEGSFHILANSGEIGWHPQWKDKLQEPDAETKGED